MIHYRLATYEDLSEIQRFTDFWLSGRGLRSKVPGAVNDCFVTTRQHKDYLRLSTVLLAFNDKELIGWSVLHHNGTLIHMLVAGPYRGKGVGTEMLRQLDPPLIRSKTDQSTGNPTPWYERHGYKKIGFSTSIPSYKKPKTRQGAFNNIDVLEKKTS